MEPAPRPRAHLMLPPGWSPPPAPGTPDAASGMEPTPPAPGTPDALLDRIALVILQIRVQLLQLQQGLLPSGLHPGRVQGRGLHPTLGDGVGRVLQLPGEDPAVRGAGMLPAALAPWGERPVDRGTALTTEARRLAGRPRGKRVSAPRRGTRGTRCGLRRLRAAQNRACAHARRRRRRGAGPTLGSASASRVERLPRRLRLPALPRENEVAGSWGLTWWPPRACGGSPRTCPR